MSRTCHIHCALVSGLIAVALSAPARAGVTFSANAARRGCCEAPDNGGGTVDYPPRCAHDKSDEPMLIIDGLPPGTTIELHGPWTSFTNDTHAAGGILQGTTWFEPLTETNTYYLLRTLWGP